MILRHALSHALVPVTTIAGVQLAALMGGAIATEIIFDWPGLGAYAVKSILQSDYNAIMGFTEVLKRAYNNRSSDTVSTRKPVIGVS